MIFGLQVENNSIFNHLNKIHYIKEKQDKKLNNSQTKYLKYNKALRINKKC